MPYACTWSYKHIFTYDDIELSDIHNKDWQETLMLGSDDFGIMLHVCAWIQNDAFGSRT